MGACHLFRRRQRFHPWSPEGGRERGRRIQGSLLPRSLGAVGVGVKVGEGRGGVGGHEVGLGPDVGRGGRGGHVEVDGGGGGGGSRGGGHPLEHHVGVHLALGAIQSW